MFRLNVVEGFTVTILSGTEKKCRVRFPTDPEWCERVRKVKVFRTNVGRDKFTSDAPGQTDADADLFAKIRLDKGEDAPTFDSAEASRVINILDTCRVKEVTREGGNFQVVLETASGDTSILLHCPTQRQATDFERQSMHFLSSRRSQEWRTSLEPAGELFDSLLVSFQHYGGPVPINHKYTAVREVLDQCEEAVVDRIELPEEPSLDAESCST